MLFYIFFLSIASGGPAGGFACGAWPPAVIISVQTFLTVMKLRFVHADKKFVTHMKKIKYEQKFLIIRYFLPYFFRIAKTSTE